MKNNIFRIIEICFIIIYMGLGLYLLLGSFSLFYLPHNSKIGFGLLLMGYALFRLFRLTKNFRNDETKDSE